MYVQRLIMEDNDLQTCVLVSLVEATGETREAQLRGFGSDRDLVLACMRESEYAMLSFRAQYF